MIKNLNSLANLWNKTKNPKYKELWYKQVKEFANGPHYIKRRPISSNSDQDKDFGWNSFDKRR